MRKGRGGRRLDRNAALNYALSLISYRDRSEGEVRQRLSARGYPPEAVEGVISELAELEYLDDGRFSRSWIRSRRESRPASRRKIMWELRAKGVEEGLIARILDEEYPPEDEVRVARVLAEKRAVQPDPSRRRIHDYLRRRGFGYDVITEALNQLEEGIS